MGRVREASVNIGKAVYHRSIVAVKSGGEWLNDHKWDLVETGLSVALGSLAGWGLADLTWRISGGHKYETNLIKHRAYTKGFNDGQMNATKVISIANGHSVPKIASK